MDHQIKLKRASDEFGNPMNVAFFKDESGKKVVFLRTPEASAHFAKKMGNGKAKHKGKTVKLNSFLNATFQGRAPVVGVPSFRSF